MNQIKLKPVKREVIDQVPLNYYIVEFVEIWDINEETGSQWISGIDSSITKINKENYVDLEYFKALRNDGHSNGDEIDIRPVLFATKKDALKHAKNILNQFENPNPWQSFLKR